MPPSTGSDIPSDESEPVSAATEDRLRVLTNRHWLDGRIAGGRPVGAELLRSDSPFRLMSQLLRMWQFDAALIDCAVVELLVVCAFKRCFPFVRCAVVAVDMVLTKPAGVWGTAKFIVRRWLLGAVDDWIFYHRDTSALQQTYRIPSSKICFIPFKPNTRELLLQTPTSDQGYFIACGRSNRDYASLVTAFSSLPYRCVILAPWGNMGDEVTSIDGVDRPSNVILESDDGTAVSWNRWIAGSTGVILPIEPGMLSPSGIGTYLVAMALGKPVVITDGPATRGLVDGGEAVVVPPSDPSAIKAAVTRLVEDPAYREQLSERGRKYALGLGGEERLRDDLLGELGRVLTTG